MKKPAFHYTCLAIVAAATVIFQVARVRFRFPNWLYKTSPVEEPFVLQPTPQGFMIGWTSSLALKAGVQPGDILKSIDGKAVAGLAAFGQAVANARPGSVLKLTLQPQQAHKLLPERTVSLVVPQPENAQAAAVSWSLVLFIVIPLFCLVLGFWVAVVRIRDPLAWLLLALMLGFAGVADPAPELWQGWLRDFGAIYYAGLMTSWPIWMLLFGVYFPEPFQQKGYREWWRRVEFAVVIPLAFLAVIQVIASVGAMGNYTSVRSLLAVQTRLEPVDAVLTVAGVTGFFACIGLKLRLASSRDTRRRLRLLSAGAIIGLTPISSLILISWLNGWVLGSHFPDGLWITTFLMTFLFPITLAYVIVVERAMDVRVAVRQGLRYAFAKSGVNAVQIAFGIGSIAAVLFILRHVRPYSLPFFAVIAAAILLFIKTREAFRRLRLWIDRRFFRDAYNAEQILSELGDQVRSIVEPRPLLEKVCRTIAGSLHIARVAVLLEERGVYKPAYALGYASPLEVTFAGRAGVVEQMRRTVEPLTVFFDDPRPRVHWRETAAEERAGLEALRAQLLLPLAANEDLLGFVSLGEKRSEQPYSRSDIRLLKSVASQTGLALQNAQLSAALAREAAERERLNRELEIAREVQERLFPQQLPPVPGLDYCGICRPALGVGGDYYDFFALPDGELGVAVADVSGKGISAALMMATLHAWLRGEAARADFNLPHVVSTVSRLVFEASASERYATLFYAQYDPSSRRLAYVNAGHNPPILLNRRGDPVAPGRLSEGGTAVGLFDRVSYQQGCDTLEEGGVLVAFTDGITEAMNRAGEEWGEQRLIEVVRRADSCSAGDIVRHIFAAIETFTAGTEQYDDMTLVVLRATDGTAPG